MAESGRTAESPKPASPPVEAGDQELRGALHDVANALTVVLGWLDLAGRELGEQPTAARSLSIAQGWARHGRGIALRAIGGARSQDHETPDDVGSLVREALAAAEPQAEVRGVQLTAELEGDAACLRVRSWPLALQALTNLVLNAAAFTKPSTTVRVLARSDDRDIVIVVTDQGPGIESARKGRLFDGGPSSRPEGNGIGLRHARTIAVRTGGALEVLDSSEGAVFELRWPMATGHSSAPPPRARAVSLSGRKVLVFDDDDAVLCLLQTGLEARGAEVVTARHAEGVRAALLAGVYDAALIDLSPLGERAGSVLRTMKQEHPLMRLVLISGSAGAPPRDAVDVASAWIRKPFEVGEIVAAVAGVEG